jgi:hypothetical protein
MSSPDAAHRFRWHALLFAGTTVVIYASLVLYEQ